MAAPLPPWGREEATSPKQGPQPPLPPWAREVHPAYPPSQQPSRVAVQEPDPEPRSAEPHPRATKVIPPKPVQAPQEPPTRKGAVEDEAEVSEAGPGVGVELDLAEALQATASALGRRLEAMAAAVERRLEATGAELAEAYPQVPDVVAPGRISVDLALMLAGLVLMLGGMCPRRSPVAPVVMGGGAGEGLLAHPADGSPARAHIVGPEGGEAQQALSPGSGAAILQDLLQQGSPVAHAVEASPVRPAPAALAASPVAAGAAATPLRACPSPSARSSPVAGVSATSPLAGTSTPSASQAVPPPAPTPLPEPPMQAVLPLHAQAEPVGHPLPAQHRQAARRGRPQRTPSQDITVRGSEAVRGVPMRVPGNRLIQTEARFRHTRALNKLKEMGFSDDARLRDVLTRHEGNVRLALSELTGSR